MSVIDTMLARYARTNWRGFGHLVGLLKNRRGPLMLAVSTDGLKFRVNPFNYIDSFILKYGYYEREVLNAILSNLTASGVLWDVGSNIGLHATTVKHVKSDAQVVCFEPSPVVFNELCRNASANATDLQLFSIGLSHRRGYAPLSVKVDGNPGLTSFRPLRHIDYDLELMAWCDTGESIVSLGLAPPPTVLKIDVEGFELEVLRGMGQHLKSDTLRAVVFEAHPDAVDDGRATPLFDILRESGFEVAPLAPTNTHEKSEPTNYLAFRA